EFGFATKISEKLKIDAVAFSTRINNPKQDQMSKEILTKKEAETLFDKMAQSIKQFLNPKQVKVVQDATGEKELSFDELDSNDTPSDGDVATIDGKPATEDITMPNGDVYTFPNGDGVLVIVPKKTEDDDEA